MNIETLRNAVFSGRKVVIPITGNNASTKQDNIRKTLEDIFGSYNGSYFTISEQIIPNTKLNTQFKVVLVEDAKENKYQIWFELGSS